ncbi:DUF3465 domain-containing protein [Acetobacter orleanensis]|nr:hypothetical protein AD949_05860 [Acetobacter orleanensis]PCD79017.1 DUF3465 domain-containing protein [Acetobacter orleanensis]
MAYSRLLLAALLLSGLTGLTQPANARHWRDEAPFAAIQTVSPTCDNQDFLSKQLAFENGGAKADTPVHICGKVLAVSPNAKRTRSGWHGYFYLAVSPSVSIRIVSGLDEMHAPTWPWVSKGDQVEVVGRYYYDSIRRQGVDWTHHGTGRSWHVPGYVTVNGTRYD